MKLKSFYDENDNYTKEALTIEDKFQRYVEANYDFALNKGYSLRELTQILMTVLIDCETNAALRRSGVETDEGEVDGAEEGEEYERAVEAVEEVADGFHQYTEAAMPMLRGGDGRVTMRLSNARAPEQESRVSPGLPRNDSMAEDGDE